MLTLSDFQRLAVDLKLYDGGIDGQFGPKTKAAMDALTIGNEVVRSWPSRDRVIIAGIQLALKRLGYDVGVIDGLLGQHTQEAFNAWQYKKAYGKKEKLDQVVINPTPVPGTFPSQKNVARFYGNPGPEVKSQLVSIQTPYPMVIDWELNQKINSFQIHRKCADSAVAAMTKALQHYGYPKIHELGLDRFAGSYNHRKMRGGSSWSMHAYGCAIDFYAEPNGLRTRCPDALFCGQDYVAWFDIWESVGWTSLGRAIGRDWMHIQAASM